MTDGIEMTGRAKYRIDSYIYNCRDKYNRLIIDGDKVAFNYSGDVMIGMVEERRWLGGQRWEIRIRHIDREGVVIHTDRYERSRVLGVDPFGSYPGRGINSLSKVKNTRGIVILT